MYYGDIIQIRYASVQKGENRGFLIYGEETSAFAKKCTVLKGGIVFVPTPGVDAH